MSAGNFPDESMGAQQSELPADTRGAAAFFGGRDREEAVTKSLWVNFASPSSINPYRITNESNALAIFALVTSQV
jgi:hypothetical protein